jgi:hypothetical protein
MRDRGREGGGSKAGQVTGLGGEGQREEGGKEEEEGRGEGREDGTMGEGGQPKTWQAKSQVGR